MPDELRLLVYWRPFSPHSGKVGNLTTTHRSDYVTRQLICYVGSAMSEKKRKYTSQEAGEPPHKKAAPEPIPAEVVKVSFLPEEDEWAPIVGMV